MARKLHPFPGNRRIPPGEVARLVALAESRGETVKRCHCGCGEPLIGRRAQTKWASDTCRKRAARRAHG